MVIFMSVLLFGEFEWFVQFVCECCWFVIELQLNVGVDDEVMCVELQQMFVCLGLNFDVLVVCLLVFLDVLLGLVQGKKLCKEKWYWMEVMLYVYLKLFFLMCMFIWYMQLCWGGLYDYICVFVVFDVCVYFDVVEKDWLLYEIWCDDYVGNMFDVNDDEDDVCYVMIVMFVCVQVVLYLYYWWEMLYWFVYSYFKCSEYE